MVDAADTRAGSLTSNVVDLVVDFDMVGIVVDSGMSGNWVDVTEQDSDVERMA